MAVCTLGHVESGTGLLFHSCFLVLHPMNAGLHCDLRSFAARAKRLGHAPQAIPEWYLRSGWEHYPVGCCPTVDSGVTMRGCAALQ